MDKNLCTRYRRVRSVVNDGIVNEQSLVVVVVVYNLCRVIGGM
jgi:hypothetical protein